jgi:hypothetical protein
MTLSRHEQEILDRIADTLTEEDPELVAEFDRRRHSARSSATFPVCLRDIGLLVTALVVLIIVSTVAPEWGATGTALLTAGLIVPWLVIATGSARRTTGRPSP